MQYIWSIGAVVIGCPFTQKPHNYYRSQQIVNWRYRVFSDRHGFLIMSLSQITTWSLLLSKINSIWPMYAVNVRHVVFYSLSHTYFCCSPYSCA